MGTDDHTSSHARRPSTVVRRAILVALCAVAPVALLAPATAAAADLTADGGCFAAGQSVTISGTAFTPGAPVAIAGDVAGAAQADATGAFTAQITAPAVGGLGPKTVTVTAVDRINASNTATLRLAVVREAFGSNLPLAGRPTEITTWRFAGFAPGQPIYGHFVLDGRSRSDYRFGVATGDCGTLTVRAPRMAGVEHLRPGRWTLKLDQRPRYRPSSPGNTWRFRIVRRSSNEGRDDREGGGAGRD
jgi:hypothetical protein